MANLIAKKKEFKLKEATDMREAILKAAQLVHWLERWGTVGTKKEEATEWLSKFTEEVRNEK